MKRILKDDELTPGEWYWVRTKGGSLLANGKTTNPGIFTVSQVLGGLWKSIMNGMWCDKNNSQALEIYEIYGPIPRPTEHDAHMMNSVPDMDRTVSGVVPPND